MQYYSAVETLYTIEGVIMAISENLPGGRIAHTSGQKNGVASADDKRQGNTLNIFTVSRQTTAAT